MHGAVVAIAEYRGIGAFKQLRQRAERTRHGVCLGKSGDIEEPFRRAGRGVHAVAGAQPLKIHKEIVGLAAECDGLDIDAGLADLQNPRAAAPRRRCGWQ